jgi:hypothetical protein
MRYEHLSHHPKVFAKVTGLTISEFDGLVAMTCCRRMPKPKRPVCNGLIVSMTSVRVARLN